MNKTINIKTRSRTEFVDITGEVSDSVDGSELMRTPIRQCLPTSRWN